jgi:uncharacterized protein
MLETCYSELLQYINEIPVVDTHEHTESEDVRIARKVDIFNTYMMHYASCDLISAGMTEEDMNFLKGESEDLEKKWLVFDPFWKKARNTAYCQSLLYSTRDIYGIDDITKDTYVAIDQAMKLENKKGLYKKIFKDICNIEISILDSDVNCDKQFFVSAANLDEYLLIKSKDSIVKIEKQFNLSINSLSDWVRFIQNTIHDYKNKYGVICLKSALAYQRTIQYDRVPFSEADGIFNKILTSKEYLGWYTYSPVDFPTRPLEDYMMHILVQAAVENDLPIQFHTGLQEGNGNTITNSNPINLVNLFLEYPKARFDVFHAGYPYGGELCAIVKNFRNVYVDLCWAHIISREYTVRFLENLLDTVPMNKIFGFGGDYTFVEGVCGHLRIAKENIALALCNKIEKKYMNRHECMDVAKRLLNTNPKEFFGL